MKVFEKVCCAVLFLCACLLLLPQAGEARTPLRLARVPLIVELGRIQISISEFLNLGFGDVLQLDTKVKDEMPVLVGRRPKFLCRPGTAGKTMAVQVTRSLNNSVEGDEETDE